MAAKPSPRGEPSFFAHLTSQQCSNGRLQYAIVLDAGSTGSRIHVYRFNYCKSNPVLEDEVFRTTKPGLSHYTYDPAQAADSLDVLMQAYYHCTPLTLKATAGLRMLDNGMGNTILEHVEKKLRAYPFPLVADGAVEIMGGDQEGVFAWITLNFLLGKIGHPQRVPTAGIMDLGGGSTQIVFEEPSVPHGDHRIEIEFAGHSYVLYQHSYDGYGLMQGRKKIGNASLKANQAPCLPHELEVEFEDSLGKPQMLRGSAKGFDQCSKLIASSMFNKEGQCMLQPCSFDGVFMPAVSHQELYVFSYFFDKFANPFELHQDFYVGQVRTAANDICSPNPPPNLSPEGTKEITRNKFWCTDLGFIYSLLSIGYSLPDDRKLLSTKKVNGIEIGWSLGAAIKMIETTEKCAA
ncbi:Guanosine-diphosphatase [Kappamyces sp. JEL0680]|nr:Guanosine-diphosphatase [Kappamyces sp. JEL0680]